MTDSISPSSPQPPIINLQPPPPTKSPQTVYPFTFTGDGKEYFRIWIVNCLLSIITLGIYSPWAKVAREQYFHRHLFFNQSSFEYHGNPKAILKGRSISVTILIVLSCFQKFIKLAITDPAVIISLQFIFPIAYIFGWVYLVIKSLQFRAANTSYRGVFFSFNADYSEGLLQYLGGLFFSIFTLGLWSPRFIRDWNALKINNHSFGKTPFRYTLQLSSLYWLFIPIIACMLAVGILLAAPLFVNKDHILAFISGLLACVFVLPVIGLFIVTVQSSC